MRQSFIIVIALLIQSQIVSGHIADSVKGMVKCDQANYIILHSKLLNKEDAPFLIDFGIQYLEEQQGKNDKQYYASACHILGLGHYHSFKYYTAIDHFFKALLILEDEINHHDLSESNQISLENNLAILQANIGYVYDEIKDHQMAIKYFNQSISLLQNHHLKENLAWAMNGLSLALLADGKSDLSLKIFEDLLAINMAIKDSLGIAGTYNNIGLVYYENNQLDQAEQNFLQAIEIGKFIGEKKRVAASLFNLGVLYGKQKNITDKLSCYNEAIQLLRSIDDQRGIIKMKIEFAHHYFIFNDYAKSLNYLSEALEASKKYNEKDFEISIYQYLSELYTKMGDNKNALINLRECMYKQDSLYRNNNEKIVELNRRFEEEQKQGLEKELEIQQLTNKQQSYFKNFLIIIIVLLIVLAALTYNRFRLKQKTAVLLSKQKKELEIANLTKDKFFSIIAHDLKNPMGVCFSISDHLYESYQELDDMDKYALVEQLKKSSALSFQLLENLLQWSLSQSGKIQFNPEKINIFETIESNIALLQEMATNKNIRLNLSVNQNLFAMADKNMISLV